MEGSNNHTSAYNISNNTSGIYMFELADNIVLITNCLFFCVALPMICIAMHGMCSLVTSSASPVYVINLLITDLIQLSAKAIFSLTHNDFTVFQSVMRIIYWFSVQTNIFFMMCISAERYIMIAHPFLFRNIQTIRKSVFVSVGVWIISAILSTLSNTCLSLYWAEFTTSLILLPYPLLIFFYVGTWRALSRSTSIPQNDQRRIMRILFLILCIYTISFLPVLLLNEWFFSFRYPNLIILCHILLGLNPLFDSLLYVFMRRDAKVIICLPFCVSNKREENTTLRESHC